MTSNSDARDAPEIASISSLSSLRSGSWLGAKRLTLACGLEEFPPEIFALADSLEILDLSNNQLSSLPDDLPRLKRLRVLFCSGNNFTAWPAVLGQCPQLSMIAFKANRIRSIPSGSLPRGLRWLILTDNQLEALPADIGRCTQLQKLMLAGNRLRALPPELATCKALELLRISANQLGEFPAFLLELPRLSWLAYAGNPFCEQREQAAISAAPMARIDWQELHLQQQLGEGASGVIHQAQWQQGDRLLPVAVKLFKGDVTSDGLPGSELAACINAGSHQQLIQMLGQVVGHPADQCAMVMPLIDPAFRNLAQPPSLDSCTRDIYAPDAGFALRELLLIAQGIASAARHLHAQGLMHGDLYAHNILHKGCGAVLLGDFGAASFLASDNQQQAEAMQRLEIRAFACLLEELLARCSSSAGSADDSAAIKLLDDLKCACFQDPPGARPLFAEVEQILMTIH
jgi:hypothetical protein